MSDSANTNTERKPPKPRRSIAIRILRLLVFAGLSFFLLLAAAVGFSETSSFRSMLRDFIVETANSSLNAQLSLEEIEGNLFSGWKISGVALHDAHGPVAEIESIILRYNIFRLPWKNVTVKELTLNAPRIFVTRAAGRDWNINTLVDPSEDDDTTTGEFDWSIHVDNVRIHDGLLVVFDSSTPPPRRDRFDSQHMHIRGLDLALSAGIFPDVKQLSLNRCSWENEFGEVAMKNLSGDIEISQERVSISGLSIQTIRSGIILSATVDDVDVLGGFDVDGLADYPFRLSADAPEVDLRDLQYFLPSLDILGGNAAFELDADGTLRDLKLQHLRMETFQSEIEFAGRLRNILDGADMHIDVISEGSVIHGDDIPLVLPGIPVLDMSGLGAANFSLLRFSGRPLDFHAEVEMQSDAGDLTGSMDLDLTAEDMVYDGLVSTQALNLGAVLGNPRLTSALTMQAGIQGSGTRIGSIVSSLNVTVDSSRYQRYLMDQLRCSVDVRRDSLTLNLSSHLGKSSIAIDGGMSFQPDSVTGFRVHSDAVSLDLSKALNNDELASDLTFSLEAHGDGIDPASASGIMEIAFKESQFANITLDPDTFRCVLQQSDAEAEYLLLESQYADVRIDGRFDFPRFIDYMDLQMDSLSSAMAEYSFAVDSTAILENAPSAANLRNGTKASSVVEPAVEPDTTTFMDVEYSIALKHPERIARYFDASTFLVRGNYSGSIRGGMSGFAIDGELRLSDFYFVDSARTWLSAGLRLNYDIKDLQINDPLENLRLSARLSAADMNINGLRMSRTSVQFEFAERKPWIRLRSMVDTLLQMDVEAEAQFANHVLDVRIPRIDLLYLKKRWSNTGEVSVQIDSAGIALEGLQLAHDRLRLSLDGHRSMDGENDFTLYGDSLDIPAVEYFLSSDSEALKGESFSGVGSVQARITGTDAEPLMAADVYVDNLGYRGMNFGELVMEARYFDRKMEMYSELAYLKPDGREEKVFFISGTVPTDISFDGATRPPVESNANLRMQMKAFPLALIEDFLGLFSPLEGTADADLTVTGTASDPSFQGFLTVADARGRFVFNNMDYLLNMRIEAIDQDLRIVEATMRNSESDWAEGKLTATGRISSEAFVISNFDLAVEGKLKVLTPSSRSVSRNLYGDLYISTGDEPLTYSGRLDRSKLLGNIIIEEGKLTVPLEESAGAGNDYGDITYLHVDDTTTVVTSSLSAGRFARGGAEGSADNAADVSDRSMLEGLAYAFTLATANPVRVEIPLPFTREELDATLDIENLKVNNFGGGGIKFVGEVKLGKDSYYIFFGKRMSASGSLRFTRDPSNPDLDLKAVYSDYYQDPKTEVRRQVFVTIFITGTKSKPEVKFDMRWDYEDGERIVQAGDVESDAFSFIMLGTFTKDMSTSEYESNVLANSPELLSSQLTSSLLSNAANQFLTNAGLDDILKRVEFAGLGTENSRVKVTSEIGRAIITYDGKINNPESANMSVEFPLSKILGIPWTNLVVQVSRMTIDETYESTTQTQEYSIWELKILQRFSF